MQISAGICTNGFATVNDKVTLQGVGGIVHMLATVPPPNGMAILTTNTDVTIDHFEFSGAQVADQNGAGELHPVSLDTYLSEERPER